MTHAELLEQVLQLVVKLGLLAHSTPDSRHEKTNTGFPDLVIAGPKGAIFAELKSDGDETTADQDNWIWTLLIGGNIALVWRSDHLASGEIREQLEELC